MSGRASFLRAPPAPARTAAPQSTKVTLPAWAAAIKEASAGRVKPVCPVHVMIDGYAGGSVIPVEWQQGYIDAISALGAEVTSTMYPDDDHFSLPASCVSETRAWLTARL